MSRGRLLGILHFLAIGLVDAVAAQPPSASAEAPFDAQLRPRVTGRRGVVVSLHPLSSQAGLRILMQGGNAFDAAVATAMATSVVDPKDSSMGGQGFATIYVAKEKRVRALNFYGVAPKAATIEALKDKPYKTGYLSTPVPSNLKGYEALHRAYGRLPWKDVVTPALELARDGFIADEEFTWLLDTLSDRLEYPSTKRVFFPSGQPPRNGDVFRQPDLARTLTRVATEGADVFYKGDIARSIDAFYRKNGGILTYDDLGTYEAQWLEPIKTTYRGYTVYTQPPNSSGIAVLMQLNILEGFDLKKLGHNSPEYLHLIGEVQRIAIADRNRYVADVNSMTVPFETLLSKEFGAQRRALILPGRTLPSIPPPARLPASEKSSTTHLTVVDGDGNMVSLTQTLGSWYGSGVVAADTGVLFSNQLRHLHTEADSPSKLGPGRKPRSNQSPLIVLKDGEPVLALGTPGNDGIWQRLVQALANIIDFGMDVQQAVAAPRMIYGGFQETGTEIPPEFEIEDRVLSTTRDALVARGYKLSVIPSDEGSLNGVWRDVKSGMLIGGADPRRLGTEKGKWGPSASVYAVAW